MRPHGLQARVRADQDIVEHAQVSEHAARAEGAGQSPSGEIVRRQAVDVAAGETTAPRRVYRAGHEIEHGRLAGAVGADDATSSASLTVSDSPLTAVTPPNGA